MSLRTRLAWTLVAIVVPVVLLYTGFRYVQIRDDVRERIANRTTARVVGRATHRCDRDPAGFHVDHPRGFEVFAYRPDLTSANSRAPEFPESLAGRLDGEGPVVEWGRGLRGSTGRTAAETRHDDGPCALLLILWQRPVGPGPWNLIRRAIWQSGLAAGVLLIVGLLAGGPLVRRIQRLTDAVEEIDENDYRVEVEAEADDEIGELARAFNQAGDRVRQTIDELEARDRALRDYVANTTHDLAIPVTVLQHRLRKIARQVEGSGADETIESALEETQYIASLVSNVGAAARLEAGEEHLSFHEVSLCDVVERVASRHEPMAEQKEIDFNWAVPDEALLVEADSTLVEQAVSNCVQNAIQYNTPGGHVGLVLDRTGEGFEIRIVDDGPGVPEEMLGRMTDREARDDEARTRRPEGQGFGLAIAGRVVAAHGWEIAFANREEGGLEVRIEGRREPM